MLTINQKFLIYRIVVVLPQRVRVMADIAIRHRRLVLVLCIEATAGQNLLDGHEPNTGQNAHDAEQLPELDIFQQPPATDIYTMRTIHINTALHENVS